MARYDPKAALIVVVVQNSARTYETPTLYSELKPRTEITEGPSAYPSFEHNKRESAFKSKRSSMKSKKTDSLVLLATVVLTTGIFVLDLLTPLGVAIWVFYMLPRLIVSRATERLTPFILAAVCTVLI